MPATEQTWRDQKRLHTIFAISGVVMLIATIWMFVADHSREWKPLQRAANKVEMEMTEWRKLQFLTEDAVREHQELAAQYNVASRAPVNETLVEEFKAEVQSAEATQDYSFNSIDRHLAALSSAQDPESAREARGDLIRKLRSIAEQAKFREDTLLGQRKFKSADRDAAVAALGLLVRDDKPLQDQIAQQQKIDEIKQELDDLTRAYQAAEEHRLDLEDTIKEITAEEDLTADALAKNEAELDQLRRTNVERRSTYFTWVGGRVPVPGKKWLELPILDAFNSPRKIDNLWSDDLTIDYNFQQVRRFDRCTTCHQLIDKTLPGSATDQAYPQARLIHLVLQPPSAEEPVVEDAVDSTSGSEEVDGGDEASGETDRPFDPAAELERVYGLRLAPEGLLNRNDVTVQFVEPQSLAATAEPHIGDEERNAVAGDNIRSGLMRPDSAQFSTERVAPGFQVGDVIIEINQDGNRVYESQRTTFRLLDAADVQQPVLVTVRRGMLSPYSSHPRLDLFVGSLSPHKMSEFACTICHEGQGSATAFKWASHAPNSQTQRAEWRREHGWFDNHHWIYPMYPKRFAESSCLKCHHAITELQPSEKFPEPPAPKLMRGHRLLVKYACYGCHEVNGYDGSDRVGPDLRLEPNVFAAALQLKTDPGFSSLPPAAQDWAEQLIQHPHRDAVRRRLYEVLIADSESPQPRFTADAHEHLTPLFKDSENPGTLRKAGPSLRFVDRKIGIEFLADWIREPKHFRPSTRMPQFFGNRKHLDDKGRALAARYESLEVLGLATFLLSKSQPFEYLEPPRGVAAASADRGKIQFETRGCLACHTHKDFPDTSEFRSADEIVQGPDLSGIGDKFTGTNGRRWLYSWIKEPTRYHARTVMPDLFLEVIEDADGEQTDPAADIVEYLLGASSVGWHAASETLVSADQVRDEDLDALVLEYLKDTFSEAASEQYVRTGIPAALSDELRGAEVELLAGSDPADAAAPIGRDQKLRYVGGKAVAKYGCYGCHDIAGYEDAKPIGTGLADWGRKDPSKLAFEHILNYLGHGHGGHDDGHDGHGDDASDHSDDHGDDHSDDHGAVDDPLDPYFVQQIEGHHRSGFIYQKLREPRSYDYHKTENKKFNEWLRMPQFPFDAEEREAVITFVLGLVADPPAEKYIYKPDERQRALIAGREVLDKYNCAGCHMLEPQRWSVAVSPEFMSQPETKQFPFLSTHVATEILDQSLTTHPSGLRIGHVEGMPTLDDSADPIMYDDFGDPIEAESKVDPTNVEYAFDLWKPAVLNGSVYEVGVAPMNLLSADIRAMSPARGGFLAKYLVPRVVARERALNPNAKGAEAWGWVPPPLIGEGSKVQTGWLHDFLLNPYPIRPAVVLRMPRFNMTPAEASKLVNYFAALDNVEYPYEFSTRRQTQHLAAAEEVYQGAAAGNGAPSKRFEDAMKIVTSADYCVKCHLVGDYDPPGGAIAKAPNLATVYERLRPEYMRNWIASPKSILPYTSMPVNIQYDPDAPNLGGVAQTLYHGTSIDQVNALVDLLMNYDEYAKQRSPIAPMVKEVPTTPDGQPARAAGD